MHTHDVAKLTGSNLVANWKNLGVRGIEQMMRISTSLTVHYSVYIYGSPLHDCNGVA